MKEAFAPKLIMEDVRAQLERRIQFILDKTTPHKLYRWLGFLALMSLYVLRVYMVAGFYIVTYGLGIYLLNLFIGFITPPIDPDTDGPLLPRSGGEEYRPFSGKVPEFKFWKNSMTATFVAMIITLFPFLDIPVFWPILLIYFITLFALTMRNQIAHMIKYRYVPFSWGKAKYAGKGKGGGKGDKDKGEKKIERPTEALFNPATIK